VRRFSTQTKHSKAFLVSGKRTPFGKFDGSLKDITPVDLSVLATKATLSELKLDPKLINHSILANVIPSSTDTLYGARHVALKSGASIETPAYNVNRLCGSGIQAIVDGSFLVRRGEAELVLVSGSENMSMSPHLVYGARFGTKYGPLVTVDILQDSLTDKLAGCAMAITAENLAKKYNISREECDQFGLRSHQNAANATKSGFLGGEIVPVVLKKGELKQDELIRNDAKIEDMKKLKASFLKDGTVTPGTASGIVDGAVSLFIASENFVKNHNLKPLAEVGDYFVAGVDPTIMGIGPVPAIKGVLERSQMKLDEIDLIEINEAFAAQTLACVKELGIKMDRLNVSGGAIAIGHPLGASGVRLALTLARQLKEQKKKVGIASACIGGGQGIALILKSMH